MTKLPAVLEEELRYHQRIQLAFCIGLAAVGVFILSWANQVVAGTGLLLAGGGLLILLALLGAMYSLEIWPFKPRTVRSVLQKEPESVVWVYHHIVQNRPYGVAVTNFTMLYLHLDDGNETTAQIRLHKADAVLAALKPLLPQATFGYSDEKKFQYEANPLLLRRND